MDLQFVKDRVPENSFWDWKQRKIAAIQVDQADGQPVMVEVVQIAPEPKTGYRLELVPATEFLSGSYKRDLTMYETDQEEDQEEPEAA